jgi:hypothetical protein
MILLRALCAAATVVSCLSCGHGIQASFLDPYATTSRASSVGAVGLFARNAALTGLPDIETATLVAGCTELRVAAPSWSDTRSPLLRIVHCGSEVRAQIYLSQETLDSSTLQVPQPYRCGTPAEGYHRCLYQAPDPTPDQARSLLGRLAALRLSEHPDHPMGDERPVLACGALELQVLEGEHYHRFDWWAPPCRRQGVGEAAIAAFTLLSRIADSLAGPAS